MAGGVAAAMSMNLRSIDLNLLPVLQALLRERSVTRAAVVLGVSQPAASKALARLREIFGDDLLVRDGGRTILSQRGQDLLPQVEAQCRQLAQLWGREHFDPKLSARTFHISAFDPEAMMLLVRLAPILQEEAPGISLSFRSDTDLSLATNGISVDLIVAPKMFLNEIVAANGTVVTLYREKFVTLIRKDHPSLEKILENGLAGERIVVFSPVEFTDNFIRQIAFDQINQAIVFATISDFGAVPLIVAKTDLAVVVPKTLAVAIAPYFPVLIIEQDDASKCIDMALAWNRRWNADPGHRWLREVIMRVARGYEEETI